MGMAFPEQQMPADVERISVTPAEHAAADAQRPDSGLLALVLIAGHFHIAAQPAQLRHELGLGAALASPDDLTRAGRRIGLKARAMTRQPVRRLETVPLPCIVEIGPLQYSIFVARTGGKCSRPTSAGRRRLQA